VAAGLTPASFKFKIDAKKEKNDKGTFFIPTVEQGARTSDQELGQALNWFKKLRGAGAEVKLHDETEVVVEATTGEY
jgi:hypothetical protein